MNKETLYTIALTRINYFNLAALKELYQKAESASAIVENSKDIREILPDVHPRIVEALRQMEEPMKRAEIELEYCEKHHIQVLCHNDASYPQRLRECDDAPLVLYYLGSADLNSQRIVNIVGTRHCTAYGKDLVRRFCQDLRQECPDVLIVSGLAYGIDICAHREALANGFDTMGVLAHGLDTIYPSSHRETARKMVSHGGLLTEFMTQTNADKRNFVQRNRIVAGMSDACILVESAARGGGLITAGISRDYNRDVFAFPGQVGAQWSEGCNNLIRDNGASLITCAEDFIKSMRWENEKVLDNARQGGIEREMFPDLSPEEQLVVDTLHEANDLSMSLLTVRTNLPVSQLSSLLFTLELKGVLRPLAGGLYHLNA